MAKKIMLGLNQYEYMKLDQLRLAYLIPTFSTDLPDKNSIISAILFYTQNKIKENDKDSTEFLNAFLKNRNMPIIKNTKKTVSEEVQNSISSDLYKKINNIESDANLLKSMSQQNLMDFKKLNETFANRYIRFLYSLDIDSINILSELKKYISEKILFKDIRDTEIIRECLQFVFFDLNHTIEFVTLTYIGYLYSFSPLSTLLLVFSSKKDKIKIAKIKKSKGNIEESILEDKKLIESFFKQYKKLGDEPINLDHDIKDDLSKDMEKVLDKTETAEDHLLHYIDIQTDLKIRDYNILDISIGYYFLIHGLAIDKFSFLPLVFSENTVYDFFSEVNFFKVSKDILEYYFMQFYNKMLEKE